ncbi:hypothetical protein ACFWGN_18560 [Oerskovia sp. NPDC060338]|uniref:hypothetical protein n=1 Tax=Oerskovia sp. NPDC060338 TaxID=3347100 RepID=UPI00364D06DE
MHSGAIVPEVTEWTTQVDSEYGYVQDPLQPTTAVSVGCQLGDGTAVLRGSAFTNLEYVAGASRIAIMGSNEPVALGGQRMAAAGVDFSMLTEAAEQSTALRNVLNEAYPVLVRPLPEWGDLPSVLYLSVDSVQREERRDLSLTLWNLVGNTVAAPTLNVLIPLWTYAQVEALWATYTAAQAAATSAAATYLDYQRDPSLGGA